MTNLLDYTTAIKFWLKDYEKTKNKYQNYKTEKYKVILEDIYYDINRLVEDATKQNNYYFELQKNINSKGQIRQLKTAINGNTYHNIIKIFDDLWLNDNEKRSFAIRFYLDNYEDINEEMSDYLIYIVENQ